MLPALKTPRPLALWKMREYLEDLWLVVDALLEPGGVKMMRLPCRDADGPGDRLEQEERLLWEVRESLTILLQAIDEELLRCEEQLGRESFDKLPRAEREMRLEAREVLEALRGRLMTDFTKSLTELNRS